MRTPALFILLIWAGCGLTPFKEIIDSGAADGGDRDGNVKADGDGPGSDAKTPECPGSPHSADVDDEHEPGNHTSIAVDGKGDLHISHYAAGPTPTPMGVGGWHDARYTTRRGGAWKSEDILDAGVVGGFTALGLGPSGEVHVVFYDWANKDLIYAWRDASGWKAPEVMHTSGIDGWGNDLAVDAAGTVHVATYSGINDEVHYLRRVGSKWEPAVVVEPAAGEFGPKSGIAVDSGGSVHFSVCDGAGQLKYRSGKDGKLGPAQILDTGLGEQCNTDLAVDGKGDAHISYHEFNTKVLRYVGQTKGVFGTPVTLDSSGKVGLNSAIVATDEGELWIAYYDATNLDLKVIRRRSDGGGWGPPQAVDSAGYVGRYVSAALGTEGELHVSHWNGTTKALRHTRICP